MYEDEYKYYDLITRFLGKKREMKQTVKKRMLKNKKDQNVCSVNLPVNMTYKNADSFETQTSTCTIMLFNFVLLCCHWQSLVMLVVCFSQYKRNLFLKNTST